MLVLDFDFDILSVEWCFLFVHEMIAYTLLHQWVFDFSDDLLFGEIDTVSYSLMLDNEEPLVMHAARPPVGTSVTIETSTPCDAMVSVSVIQCKWLTEYAYRCEMCK